MAQFSMSQIIENIQQAKKELISTRMFLDEAQKLDSYIEHIKQPLLIMVMGEFSTGKSTFINALVGKKIAVVDALPTTAVITKLSHADEEKIMVYYRDGNEHEYAADEFNRLTAEADDESNALHERIDYVERAVPIPMLRDMTVIDSPGLNALKAAHTEATKRFVEQADTVLWMISSEKAATDTEYQGIENLSPRLKPIVIVNKMDLLDEEEDDPETFLQNIRGKLKDKVQAVIGISAEYAFQGKIEDNEELLTASNFAAFNDIVRDIILPNRDAYKVNSLIDELNEWLYGIMTKIQEEEDKNKPNEERDYNKYVENRSVLSRVEDGIALIAEPLKEYCQEATNNASALALLGVLHEFGLVLVQNESQAMSAYEKAAVKNNSFAQFALAKYYLRKNSHDKAVYWVNKAIKAEYPLANSLLQEIERKKIEDEQAIQNVKSVTPNAMPSKSKENYKTGKNEDKTTKFNIKHGIAIATACLVIGGASYLILSKNSDEGNTQNVIESTNNNEQTKKKRTEQTTNNAQPQSSQQKSMLNSNANVVATYYVVNCQESITLRSAPSTSASEITQIPLGKAVGFIETAENGFSKINYDGLVGYGLSSYLSSEKPNSIRSEGRRAQVVNCNEWITLRSSPSVSASSLAQIPLGAYVICVNDVGNEFYEVEYNGKHGYVLKAYLEYR